MAEHIPSILYAPTFCIHVNQAILHKDIRCQITLNDLVMNKPAFFKHNQAGTCIHHPHKSNNVWPHTFLLHLSKQLMCVLPLPTFHMSQYHCGPSDHISRWHLIKHSPIFLKTPTFCIRVHHATPHKDIRLATTFDDLLTNTPALFKGNYTGSYIQHPRKVTEFGCTPSCCIC